MTVKGFTPELSEDHWRKLAPAASPARAVCDLFWMSLPWARIQEELGAIHVLDIGCGSGRYGEMLDGYSGGRVASYLGFDVMPREDAWRAAEARNPTFRFRRIRGSGDLADVPPQTTMIMSQSALEHIEDDIDYFRGIRRFVGCASRPVLQVHLFPAPACLRLYSWHGVRQYTVRTSSYLARLFRDSAYSVLFRLGGARCGDLHWEYITGPQQAGTGKDWRDTRPAEYEARLRDAILSDIRTAAVDPLFFALVIHSHYERRLF